MPEFCKIEFELTLKFHIRFSVCQKKHPDEKAFRVLNNTDVDSTYRYKNV